MGGLGRFTLMLGAFRVVGNGADGPTKEGIDNGGWLGMLPGRFMAVVLPGLTSSVFLKV